MTFSPRIGEISVGVVSAAKTEVDCSLRIQCHAEKVNAVRQLLPTLRDDDLLVSFVISICIYDEREFALAGDKDSLAERITGRRQSHADGGTELTFAIPKDS